MVGEKITYKISVENLSKFNITQIRVQDTLPAGLELLSTKPSAPAPVAPSTTIEWPLFSLGPLQNEVIQVQARVDGAVTSGELLNKGNVTTKETGPQSFTDKSIVREAPKLSVTKSVSPAIAHPGETVTFTLVAENQGKGEALNPQLIDTLPAGLTFVSATDAITPVGDKLMWDIGTDPGTGTRVLRPRETVTKTIQMTVPPGTYTPEVTLDNTVELYSDKDHSYDQASVVLQDTPAFTILKRVDHTDTKPGATLHYTLEIAKSGGAATEVYVTDQLDNGQPQKLDFQSISSPQTLVTNSVGPAPNADPDAGFLSWQLTDFPVGRGNAVITYDVSVTTPLDDGTTISNQAHLNAKELQSTVVSNQVDVTVRSKPKLRLTKQPSTRLLYSHPTSDPTLRPSESITYNLVARNLGDAVATGVTVSDTLPDELVIDPNSTGGNVLGQTVTWTIPSLEPGKDVPLTVTAQVKDNIANGFLLPNEAHIDTTMPGVGSNTSSRTEATVTSNDVLQLTKAPKNLAPKAGGNISYKLTYENIGTATTPGNVIIEDQIPANTRFVSATGGGAETGPGSGVVQWDLAPLKAGDSGSVTLTLQVDDPLPNGTTLNNSASIKNKGTNNTTPAIIPPGNPVTVTSAPLLTLTKDSDAKNDKAVVGTKVTYTITYENIGSDVATGLVIVDQVPKALEKVTSMPPADNINGRIWTWNKASLPAKQKGEIFIEGTVSAQLRDGEVFTNSASVTSKLLPNPVGNSETLTAQDAALSLAKVTNVQKASSGISATNTPGQTIYYGLEYVNSGTAKATGLILIDDLPPDVTYVPNSANPPPTSIAGQRLTWQLPDLDANRSDVVYLAVRVNDNVPDGRPLINHATLGSATTATVRAKPKTVIVTSSPNLVLTKRLDRQINQAAPGDTLSWEITLENKGADEARNVTVQDTLPDNVTYVPTPGGGSYAAGPPATVTWGPLTLQPNTTWTQRVKADVDDPLANGTVLLNQVSATGEDRSGNAVPPLSDTETTSVTSSPILEIDIDVDKPVITAGDGAVYTLVIRNTGNDIAYDVEVAATVPQGTFPQTIDHGGSFTPDNAFAVWQIGALPPAGSITLQFSVSVPVGTPNGTPELVLAGIEGSNAGFNADAVLTVVSSSPVLSLDKTGPNSVEAGDLITWTLSYDNLRGNTAALGTVLRDTLPANTTFESATSGGTETSPGSGIVEWSLGSLPAGSGGNVTVTARADVGIANGTLITNAARLSATNSPSVADTASVVERSHTELEVDITATADPIPAGDTETFTVNWGNIGNQDTTNAVITASIPPDSDLEGTPSSGGTRVGRTVQWSVADLDAGDTGSATFTVRTVAPLNNGTRLTSVADISADDGLPDSDSDDFMVSSTPIWAKAKLPDQSSVVPGKFVNFAVAIVNLGNENATNVVVVDDLPPGLRVDSAGQSGVVDTAANTVTWNLGTVAPGNPVTLTVRARVLAADTTLTNTATVSSSELPDVIVTGSLTSGANPPVPVLPRDGYLWLLLASMWLLAWRHWLRSRRFRGSR